MQTVLLWADPDDPAPDVGDLGAPVLAPQWWDEDDARVALLTSFAAARGESLGESVTLVGVGLGGTAAASLLLHQRRLGLSIGRVVLADVDWSATDPLSGTALPEPGPRPPSTRVDVLGDDDATRAVVATWQEAGWSVALRPPTSMLASVVDGSDER